MTDIPSNLVRPGMYRPLSETHELCEADVLTDLLVVSFPRCHVTYERQQDWERIQELIAPSGNPADNGYAFVKYGHHIRRKRQSSNWRHAAWNAELVHYPLDRGGRLSIHLTINPTRWAAMAAQNGGNITEQTINHMPTAEKAARLRRETLDGNTNFIPPGMRRNTMLRHPLLLQLALRDFRRVLLENLLRSGLDIIEIGWDPRTARQLYNYDQPDSMLINWRDWRVDRLEHYVELYADDSISAVRRGYYDARARGLSPASQIYEPNTLLDRQKNGLSFSYRKSANENVMVYAKAPELVRVERRWVRGDGRPEVPFTEHQELGAEGLIRWDRGMNPGSLRVVQAVANRLGQLVQTTPDHFRSWTKVCAVAASTLRSDRALGRFLSDILELGGLHYASQSNFRKEVLNRLERLQMFERLDRRENIVPVPSLQLLLTEIRGSIEAASQGASDRTSTD
ncbi:hypothetical protein HXX25_05535 [Hyphobacterium sp. CCMP332]|uniref:hypothetical protein n=1 Tax=Hyphobacterium sp. CCMP332 TaxID=2749086 RepID=UPI0016501294|nr:hypothetical protein [Hyphobacterium sp. CCMP332]QNL18854.1 hypothetical protein HXX25_05535 [Hyphobacterium sp. CCMP332]